MKVLERKYSAARDWVGIIICQTEGCEVKLEVNYTDFDCTHIGRNGDSTYSYYCICCDCKNRIYVEEGFLGVAVANAVRFNLHKKQGPSYQGEKS